jgi:hypothetical protein
VVFILAFGNVFFIYKVVAKIINRMFFYDVHERMDNWVIDNG